MTHVITGLCLRDRGCIEVCPVECIVAGQPVNDWPSVYIDPDTCIDCGACVPECPFKAIFPADEVPSVFTAAGGEHLNRVGLTGHYEGTNHNGKKVVIETARPLNAGESVNLTPDIQKNADFFKTGPGYGAKDQDQGA